MSLKLVLGKELIMVLDCFIISCVIVYGELAEVGGDGVRDGITGVEVGMGCIWS